jgi:uncharacterized membrane protein
MTQNSNKNRVIFLDLIRAFAVLNMVQGHTVEVLLGDDFRIMSNPFFALWFNNRGMTAPIFLFTAGTTFTYLFRLHKESFQNNPRVMRGFQRVLVLIGLGYLLRYPTPYIFYFKDVGIQQWNTFFAVDVLQLIGFGLLFIIFAFYVTDKLKIGDYIIFPIFIGLNILGYAVFENIDWKEFLHPFFAGYMYKGTGSNFPLFPWLTYLFCGAILGSYLAKNSQVFKTVKFSIGLIIIGIVFILSAMIFDKLEIYFWGKSYFWTTSPNLVIIRIGIVLLLTSLFSFISIKMTTIPKILILLGRNTLLIYVVHLLILYGSPWNVGLIKYFNRTLDPITTIALALIMIAAMIGLVLLVYLFNIRNKTLVT